MSHGVTPLSPGQAMPSDVPNDERSPDLTGLDRQSRAQDAKDAFSRYSQAILSAEDQVLFHEARDCAAAGAFRAAFIMTWLSAAESLKRKFRDLAQRDSQIAAVVQKLQSIEDDHRAVDRTLVEHAKLYGLITDAEHMQLSHLYTMRSLYAHPYEHEPSLEDLIAAAALVVNTVLARPVKFRHGYIADRMKLMATDIHFLDDTFDAVAEFANEVFDRVADDLRPYVLTKLWSLLQNATSDPASAVFVRRGRRFTIAYLPLGGADLMARLEWSTLIPAHSNLIAPVLAAPWCFQNLPRMSQDMVLGHMLERAAAFPQRLSTLDILMQGGHLDDRQAERVRTRAAELSVEELVAANVDPSYYVDRIIANLKQRNWYVQNGAIDSLINAGPQRVSQLPPETQFRLGNNVLQAAEGNSRSAIGLLKALSSEAHGWPVHFVVGVMSECFIDDAGKIRAKLTHSHLALSALQTVSPAELDDALRPVVERLEQGEWKFPFHADDAFGDLLSDMNELDGAITKLPSMVRMRGAFERLVSAYVENPHASTDDTR